MRYDVQPSDDLENRARLLGILQARTIQTPTGTPLLGATLEWFALILLILLMLWSVIYCASAFYYVWLLSLFFTGALYRMGHSLSMKSAFEVVESSTKLPVLLLRSFDLDKKRPTLSNSLSLWTDIQQVVAGSIQKHWSRPVIALGPPGKAHRTFRYAQVFVDGENWQPVVGSLLTACAAVVVFLGSSPGLKWELKEAIRVVQPTRLVFSFEGLVESDRIVILLQLQQYLPVPFVNTPAAFAYLAFDSEWQPIFSKELPYKSGFTAG